MAPTQAIERLIYDIAGLSMEIELAESHDEREYLTAEQESLHSTIQRLEESIT